MAGVIIRSVILNWLKRKTGVAESGNTGNVLMGSTGFDLEPTILTPSNNWTEQ
jgi:hypothetical protein